MSRKNFSRRYFHISHNSQENLDTHLSLTEKKVLRHCLYCKKERIKPQVPLMNDLPQERLGINEKYLQNTGINFFRPRLVNL